jgi:hypothetical protein
MVPEVLGIGVSAEEPEKLSHDTFPVDLLGREEWETVSEIETKLSSEKTIGDIATSEIFVVDTMLDQFATEIEVLLFWMDRHGYILNTTPRIISKIEEIQGKKENSREEDFFELYITNMDHMLGTKISSDKHPECECDRPRKVIHTSRQNTEKCTHKPENREDTCYSFRLYGCELQDESIGEIIPYS